MPDTTPSPSLLRLADQEEPAASIDQNGNGDAAPDRLPQSVDRDSAPPKDAAIGIEVIDHLGVRRIAEAFGISEQGVRKWRRTGIPKDRHRALSKLLADSPVPVAPPGRGRRLNATSKAPQASESKPRRATPPGLSRNQLRLDAFAGSEAAGDVRVLIAKRHVDHTRRHVEWAAARAEGLPPSQPVGGYRTRLALLFALDFPILTMAFAAVAQVSPIVAAGSAVALSLFLVLGAHALGGPLRELASYLPAWCRSLITAAVIMALLTAIIAVTIDLRMKGFDVANVALQMGGAASIFDDPSEASEMLPPAFQWSIARAAALVTVIATIFGIGWSYRQHDPQADFARAEKSHQRALRRYARAARRASRTTTSMIVALLLTSTLITGRPTDAATMCDEPAVLALIDTTTAYDDQDRGQIMPAIDRMVRSLEPGDRIVIRTVRDSPSSSRLLFDACAPASATFDWTLNGLWQWLWREPAADRIAIMRFRSSLRAAMLPPLQSRGDAPVTALADTLARFADEAGEIKAVWLFTDLLESVAASPEVLLADSGSLVRAAAAIPGLQGLDVHVAGIGRFHDRLRRPLSSREMGSLIDAWTALIQTSGGRLDVER